MIAFLGVVIGGLVVGIIQHDLLAPVKIGKGFRFTFGYTVDDQEIVKDLLKRPYIYLGMTALVLGPLLRHVGETDEVDGLAQRLGTREPLVDLLALDERLVGVARVAGRQEQRGALAADQRACCSRPLRTPCVQAALDAVGVGAAVGDDASVDARAAVELVDGDGVVAPAVSGD